MAGDWIPIRIDLHDDPAVVWMAGQLNVREELVVGYLVKIWSWVSRNCHGESVTHMTLSSLGRVCNLPGFPELMSKVGWLHETTRDDGMPMIVIEKYDRWLSKSAKSRMQSRLRKKNERGRELEMSRKCHATSVTNVTEMSRNERDKSVTTEQKRREYIKKDLSDHSEDERSNQPRKSGSGHRKPREGGGTRIDYPPQFGVFWESYPHRDIPKGKARAFAEWQRFTESDHESILIATRNFALTKQARDGFAKDPERFLKHREWCDFVELSEADLVVANKTDRAEALQQMKRKRDQEDWLIRFGRSPEAQQLRLSRGLPADGYER